MDSHVLQQQFQEVWAAFTKLQEQLKNIDGQDSMYVFSGKIAALSDQLMSFASQMNEEMVQRRKFQKVIDQVQLQPEAYNVFYTDQLRFYRVWLNRFAKGMTTAKEKCTIGLTVRQILLLLRLAKDTGILNETQLKPYFYFVQANFKTEVQQVLSYESLRKKYSQLDLQTIAKVKQLLEEMLRTLKQYQTKME